MTPESTPSTPRRVLFLTNMLEYGGIETNLLLLTEEFVAAGVEVHVAARTGPLHAPAEARGATVHELEVHPRSPAAVLRDVRRLRRVLRTVRPDVVHVFGASVAALLALVPGRKPPVVASVMGLGDHPFEARWRIQARNLATVLGARRVLLISPAIAEHVEALPLRRRRLHRQDVVGIRLPDPVLRDAAHREAVREELGVPAGAPVVMTTGRLAVRKAHHLFVQAAARVHAARPDARFFILGEGPKRAELEAEVARLGLEGIVTLLGEVDDVQRLHAAADVYVRPGVSEGFVGITVLEAQALEVPVVSYRTQDVTLAIDDGKTGLLVPPGDTDATADAVLGLLEDPDHAARIAAAGRRAVESRFDVRVVAAGLLETYRELAGAPVDDPAGAPADPPSKSPRPMEAP